MKLSTSIFAAFAFAAAGTANAAIITAQDSFDSIHSGTGWNGDWQLIKAGPKKPAPASIINSSLVFTGDSSDAAVRKLAKAQDSDVLIDFTLQYSGLLGTNDFVGLWLGKHNGQDADHTKVPNIGLKANCGVDKKNVTCTNDLFVRLSGTDGYFLDGSDLEAGKRYQVFGHLYKSGINNSKHYDRFDAWYQEIGTGMTSSVITAKGNSNLTSFDTLGFRSAGIDKGLQVSVDNLRVANVPEPGSVALMGLALAGLAVARRRKRG